MSKLKVYGAKNITDVINFPTGEYKIQVGVVDRQSLQPKVNLAIEGKDSEWWYTMGSLDVKSRSRNHVAMLSEKLFLLSRIPSCLLKTDVS